MALKVKMDGNSRLARQFRLAEAAEKLALALESGTPARFARNEFGSGKNKDVLSTVFSKIGITLDNSSDASAAETVIADYLGVDDSRRLPQGLRNAAFNLIQANDSYVRSRKQDIINVLWVLSSTVRNARIGREPVKSK